VTGVQTCALPILLAALGVTLGIKGIVQVAWEFPARAEFFEANRLESLTAQGITPGTPKEQMIAGRLLDNTTTGYWALANVFATELLLLLGAAIGTAAAAIAYAKRWKKKHPPNKKGEISLPTLLGWGVCLGITTIVFSLVATRARGGIAAGAMVGLTLAAGWKFRSAIKRRWKASALVALIIFGLGITAVCGYGVWKDRLPSKTMSIRWFYWTGSAEIVREHPYLGVGPGNFSDAYMKVRRPEAEEEVKTPHNFVAHALTQYGIPGGTLFVGLVVAMVIFAWRPRSCEHKLSESPPNAPSSSRGRILAFGTIVLTMIFTRWYFYIAPVGGNGAFMLFECILPAIVFGAILFGMGWSLTRCEDMTDSTIAIMRISLAAGVTAFVIHNFVSYGLWAPGTATTFWVAVGAAAALGAKKGITLRKSAIPLGVAGVAAVVVAGVLFATPVHRKLEFSQKMTNALRNSMLTGVTPATAINFAKSAADTDKRDASMAANVARLWMSILPHGKNADPKAVALLKEPRRWASQAVRRNQEKSSAWVMLGEIEREIASYQKQPDYKPAVEYFQRGVDLNPSDGRLRLRYAEILLLAGEKDKAKQQTGIAIDINSRLRKFDPTSTWLFGEKQHTRIKKLMGN